MIMESEILGPTMTNRIASNPWYQAVLCLVTAFVLVASSALLTPAIGNTERAQLDAFISETRSFVADFEQTLYDADSAPLQVSSGTIQLKRPGRFVWQYETPNRQRLVSDGDKLWLFDEELEQVTVSALEDRVSGTPLVVLMGTRPVDEEFVVNVLGAENGISWFELIPKAETADFESLYVGLDDTGLAAMELRDNFGQATQIVLSNLQADVAIDDDVFVFTVPDGVDVIGQ